MIAITTTYRPKNSLFPSLYLLLSLSLYFPVYSVLAPPVLIPIDLPSGVGVVDDAVCAYVLQTDVWKDRFGDVM